MKNRYKEPQKKAGEKSNGIYSSKKGTILPKKRDDIPGILLHDYAGIYGWGEHNRNLDVDQ